ncbi:MAG: cystathionine gamma-synthase [Dehalococcoidales bacterium]|jgi:cystathionine gamma-lyase/cystathionine beta-lyase|nr:cystathionine gamma-synthase [Dehalococcoidales bacterium]MDP6448477.1 PLP-dependent aspartate aminotransferase family protein [Dehalococcoidales bacterium]MDP6577181.1 PLP-dependent aspartate aminotransferase family protein [Dehalococcoidales bacterium]
MKFETLAIHTGERPDKAFGAVSVPIYQTSTFAFKDVGKTKGYDYSRTANPTRKVLEDTIAKLEGGQAGFAFATGMAAETTAIHLLKAGDHVISGDDIYGGTFRLFQDVMHKFGLEFTYLRMNSRQRIEEAIRPNTKMLWLETPSNPLLNIIDLEMAVDIARKHNLMTVIDNTFATPYFLRPIDYGIDLVVHSTTKYLNGHCDVLGGAVVTTTNELTEKVQFLLNAMGTPASPFDCWLVLRGIETLPVRMKQHEANAFAIANFLEGHPAVKKVFYPGLESHPGHDIARRQMKGFGGMVSFEINGGTEKVNSFLKRLNIFALAESLGGPASLVAHPATMTHVSMPEEHRKKVGITKATIRLSTGLENIDDLIKDLRRGLEPS